MPEYNILRAADIRVGDVFHEGFRDGAPMGYHFAVREVSTLISGNLVLGGVSQDIIRTKRDLVVIERSA